MGMFLALSGVIGKSQDEVVKSLTNYANLVDGSLKPEHLTTDHDNCCIVQESNHNTTIFYPSGYLEWEQSSEFMSRELNAPVFSFHVHDGDLWMYVLYVNGDIVDQFNPMPDYWDGDMAVEEINSWKGDARVVAKYVPGLSPAKIDQYLVRWDLDETEKKAYDDDEFAREDWQLLDFMRKCGLPYPLDEDQNIIGQTYSLLTKTPPPQASSASNDDRIGKASATGDTKPWWKFWN